MLFRKPAIYLLALFGLLASGLISISLIRAYSSSGSKDWKFDCQREELAPVWKMDDRVLFLDKPTLFLAGNGSDVVNGCWYTIREVEPGKEYQFKVSYHTQDVEEENRCVLARVLWLDTDDALVGRAEYPAAIKNQSHKQWRDIGQAYVVPDGAVKARVELIYRWDADGAVHFGGFYLDKIQSSDRRIVRLGSIHFKPETSRGPMDNLKKVSEYLEAAGEQKADIICLPEAVTLVGTGRNYIQASEPVPGPTTTFLGEIAQKHHMYIVAGLLERHDVAVYNTAVLIDREGQLVGKYRKVSLPREEIEGGITPGDALPVFDTDFGRVGLMICWDVTFPEVAKTLAMKGAEVILMPIWGGNLTLTKARAIENQVYLVTSSYDMKSAVFDLEGEIMEEAVAQNPVVVVEVDLNEQKLWPWLGDLKNRIPREMPTKKAIRIAPD